MSKKADDNPLLPLPDDSTYKDGGTGPDVDGPTINPKTKNIVNAGKQKGQNEAVDLIRGKIDDLYKDEPDAKEELAEAMEPGKHSVHQEFLLKLHDSGKKMEEIQTEWHAYYEKLDNKAKHEVWREFYSNQSRQTQTVTKDAAKTREEATEPGAGRKARSKLKKARDAEREKDVAAIKSKIRSKVRGETGTNRKMGAKEHFKSVAFGLMIGLFFLFVYMFTFFNERYIIPFVQPSSIAASTPIITVPNAVVSSEPRVIIPKLNVEAPIVYDVPFIQPGEDESDFEKRTQEALETGVVHYPTSQRPGEAGQGFNSNVVIVGHSSNNLFNRGDFKFAFMQIRNLELGDTFMLNYEGKQYVYKVYEKKVVAPTEVSVLGAASRPNSATLITCDPPGFNTNRMVVIAQQISPDPNKNIAVEAPEASPQTLDAGVVPGNPESLWSRIWNYIF